MVVGRPAPPPARGARGRLARTRSPPSPGRRVAASPTGRDPDACPPRSCDGAVSPDCGSGRRRGSSSSVARGQPRSSSCGYRNKGRRWRARTPRRVTRRQRFDRLEDADHRERRLEARTSSRPVGSRGRRRCLCKERPAADQSAPPLGPPEPPRDRTTRASHQGRWIRSSGRSPGARGPRREALRPSKGALRTSTPSGRNPINRRHDPGERLATSRRSSRTSRWTRARSERRSRAAGLMSSPAAREARQVLAGKRLADRNSGRGCGLCEGQMPAATDVDAEGAARQDSEGRPGDRSAAVATLSWRRQIEKVRAPGPCVHGSRRRAPVTAATSAGPRS